MLKLRHKLYDEISPKKVTTTSGNLEVSKSIRRMSCVNPVVKHQFKRKDIDFEKIPVKLFYQSKVTETFISITATDTPSQLIEGALKINHPDEHVLRIRGKAEILDSTISILQSEYCMNCITNDLPIEFEVVEESTLWKQHDMVGNREEELMDEHMMGELIEDRPSQCIPLSDVSEQFKIVLLSLEFTRYSSDAFRNLVKNYPFICLTAAIFHGDQLLEPVRRSKPFSRNEQALNVPIDFNIQIKNLPLATRICFLLYGLKKDDSGAIDLSVSSPSSSSANLSSRAILLGGINRQLFNHRNLLISGEYAFPLWTDKFTNGVVGANPIPEVLLTVEFQDFGFPIEYPPVKDYFSSTIAKRVGMSLTVTPPQNGTDLKKLHDLFRTDPLCEVTLKDQELLWKHRYFFMNDPKVLGKFLLSVNWSDAQLVEEAIKMMYAWERPQPVEALELLSNKFTDHRVRDYAVQLLDSLPPDQFLDYLPHLVQVIRNEIFHYSPLACLLIRKGLADLRSGHYLFWHLRSELHGSHTERFQLLLEGFLLGCGNDLRNEFMKQDSLLNNLNGITKQIRSSKPTEREHIFRKGISALPIVKEKGASIVIPIDPTIRLHWLIGEKCSFFDSKTLPMLLVFEGEEKSEHQIIYKAGDDLRQDILIIQMLSIMDKLWKEEGLDLAMTHYRIITTGHNTGLIEVVNAFTIFSIQMAQGGATAAFSTKYLHNWLTQQNSTSRSIEKAADNFMKSLAGYCVATYILGIGDRHNENIMVSSDGRIFHIDFGRVLGKWETFGGVSRDRAPFVFTKDFAYVIDPTSKSWEKSNRMREFIDLCCKAYNIVRKNAHVFVNLFSLMLAIGIPGLESMKDLNYLRNSLCLHMTEVEATNHFTDLVWKSLNTKATALNNFVHNMAHRKKKSVAT
eukprot:TRINITY_DN3086_c0_g2_i3.p1 TRINITY_DN3086_c0_g2~~TRINITY_DN3086_c0_g2_i3.p1  ORF type:complete len:907 (-),score=190.32 TRINITY_DN3086_c0_g2_i3:425-3145(-)